jgi:hypothetical protein
MNESSAVLSVQYYTQLIESLYTAVQYRRYKMVVMAERANGVFPDRSNNREEQEPAVQQRTVATSLSSATNCAVETIYVCYLIFVLSLVRTNVNNTVTIRNTAAHSTTWPRSLPPEYYY